MTLAERWVPIDLDGGPDEAVYRGDPDDVIEAYGELAELSRRRPAWHAQAACAGQDPRFWFPGRGDNTTPTKAICATCPVQAECLEAGFQQHYGVWGGASERERRGLRKGAREMA